MSVSKYRKIVHGATEQIRAAAPEICVSKRAFSSRPVQNASLSPALPLSRRFVSSTQHFRGPNGNIKVDMSSRHLIGVAQSRGERPYQEDTYSACSIEVPASDLDASSSTGSESASVVFVGCFDGHGGDAASKRLVTHLPELIEQAKSDEVADLLERYTKIGGYMRRFQNAVLNKVVERKGDQRMTLEERAVYACLQADHEIWADESFPNCGSTSTIAMLHSIDDMPRPFFAASRLALTVAHVGDTKAMLASRRSGTVTTLTEAHHADSRVESERLRRVGTGLVTDSFGESRWGGALANTRAIGDRRFKKLGVSGEPDIIKRQLEGQDWSLLALVSDGITEVISDQEIVDLCRGHKDPTKAAEAVVNFAEQVGGQDNMTCVIVPLPGWPKIGGTDTTLSRREYRMRQSSAESRSRRQ